MELSRYVFKVDQDYFNTMTKKRLPVESSVEDLRENLFLESQEPESLEQRLFANPTDLQLRILPTWECNLRCKHCSVLQNLKRKDPCKIIPHDVLKFCVSHMERYKHKKISLGFIGGECLLEAEKCLEILDLLEKESGADIHVTLTTNFAMKLDATMVELLFRTSNFMVSLDGDEEQHNWQRKSLFEGENPYKKTVANLKRAIKLGLESKMKVQASMQDEKFDEQKKQDQVKFLTKMGITNITYGSCHPTKQNPEPEQRYLEYLKSPSMHLKPCCEYRYMNFFSINSDNSLYSEYYAMSQKLCDLKDFDFDTIETVYKKKIKENLSVLHDEVCLNKCPVIAYCWGRCINNELHFEDFRNNPSKYCGREDLNKRVAKLAEEGSL